MSDLLNRIAETMVSKGILAADESVGTMNKRLESVGLEQTEENRFAWRRILSETNLGSDISAVILSDDIVCEKRIVSNFLDQGIVPGIKVDKGAKTLANFTREKVTEGLDGLRERMADYAKKGLVFAKWRAVLTPIPSVACIQANAHALARYAAIVQEAGMVPIVEPEVLMDGPHDIEVSQTATEAALKATFDALHWQGVDLTEVVLKPNMVMHGYEKGNDSGEVASKTLETLYKCVPAAVPGVAFLSGGQPDSAAIENLYAMNYEQHHPWRITFSYGRALQGLPLKFWGEGKLEEAQSSLQGRAADCHAASVGEA